MPIDAGTLITSFKGDTRDLDRAFQQAERHTAEHLSKVEGMYRGSSGRLSGLMGSLGSVFTGALSVFGGNLLTSGFGKLEDIIQRTISSGFEFNAAYRRARLTMTAFGESAGTTKQELEEIRKLGIDRALEFQPLAQAALRLEIMGIKGHEMMAAMKGMTAVAGVLGDEAIPKITGAFDLMADKEQAAGRALTGLERAGIPVFRVLSQLTGESVQALTKEAQAGKINAQAAMRLLSEGWEEMFGKVAEDISHGMQGQMTRFWELLAQRGGTAVQPLQTEIAKKLGQINEAIAGPFGDSFVLGINQASTKILGAVDSLVDQIIAEITKRLGGLTLGGKVGGFGYGPGVMGMIAQNMQEQNQSWIPPTKLDRETLEQAANNPQVQAFFDAIREIEGGQPNIVVGGQHFNPRALQGRHPGRLGFGAQGPAGWSTAAGNWQETQTNWEADAPQFGLTDFGDVHQQLIEAIALFVKAGQQKGIDVLQKLLEGDLDAAFQGTQPWAASPFSNLPGGKRKDFPDLARTLVSQANERGYGPGYYELLSGQVADGSRLFGQAGIATGGSVPEAAIRLQKQITSVTANIQKTLDGYNTAISNIDQQLQAIKRPFKYGERPPFQPSDVPSGKSIPPVSLPGELGTGSSVDTKVAALASQSAQLAAERNAKLADLQAKLATLKQQLAAIQAASYAVGLSFNSLFPPAFNESLKDILGDIAVLPPAWDELGKSTEAYANIATTGIPPALNSIEDFAQGTEGVLHRTAAQMKANSIELHKSALTIKERLDDLTATLPPFSRQVEDTIVSVPQGIGDIFANATQQWDGTLRGFETGVVQGFSQMLLQIAAELERSAVTRLLTSLLGSVFSAGVGAAAVPAGGVSTTLPTGPLFTHLASGGDVYAGVPYIVGDAGRPELFVPQSSGHVYPNVPQQESQVVINFNPHFHADSNGAFSRKSAEQASGVMLDRLQHRARRRGR